MASLAFLSQTRVRVTNAAGQAQYDSGAPQNLNVSFGSAKQEILRAADPTGAGAKFGWILGFGSAAQSPTSAKDTQDVSAIKSLAVVGSPYGFSLDAKTQAEGARSNQSARELFYNARGELQGRIELSDGPAYGSEILASVAQGWLLASIVAVSLAAGVGWLISRRISAPVLALTAVTTRMARGELSTRADARGQDEFGQLARSFNEMAERVQGTIMTLRRFVSDAVHDETDAAARALYFERAQTSAARLERLSRDLLDLARLEAPAASTTRAPIELVAFTRERAEGYASQVEQAGLNFEMALPAREIFIEGDAAQVERALDNLIDNAIKFTPSGGAVRVELKRERERVGLAVSDTRIGIPAPDVPQLFQRFPRGRNASEYAGSGLGLAIVHAIMQQQDGAVTIEALGQGTRVTLWWEGNRETGK